MIKRNTIQREMVLNAVNSLCCHATAEEIFEAIAKNHPNIGRGTVYRNLQKLCEEGLIRKVEVPDGADRYDRILKEHYHIKCVECGRLFDVDMPYMTNLEKTVSDTHGFSFLGHDIVFKGLCPDCKIKTNNKGGLV